MKYNVIGHNKSTNRKEIVLVLNNQHKISPKQSTELINLNKLYKVKLKESVCCNKYIAMILLFVVIICKKKRIRNTRNENKILALINATETVVKSVDNN